MRISVLGPAYVRNEHDELLLSDLKRFDGVSVDLEGDNLSGYVESEELREAGLSGGGISMVYEPASGLRVETTFVVDRALDAKEIFALVLDTVQQWADGIGSSDEVICGLPDKNVTLGVWDAATNLYSVRCDWSDSELHFAAHDLQGAS